MEPLRPFFSFYGGKYRAAPRYPAPAHRLLIEPFAGSAGYAVRHWTKLVVLYDADPILAGVWDYLIRVPAAEVLRLPLDVPDVRLLPSWVPQEARWLIGFWLNAAAATPHLTPSAWARSGPRANGDRFCVHWGRRARERIASQVDRVRHWRIRNTSFEYAPPPSKQRGSSTHRTRLHPGAGTASTTSISRRLASGAAGVGDRSSCVSRRALRGSRSRRLAC